VTALFYFSAAVFLAGMTWRVFTWLRAPVPLKIPLTPGPSTTAGVARRLAGEAFLFRSLIGADRALWAAAWLLHFSFLLLAAGHIGGLVIPGRTRAVLGLTEDQFHHLAQVAGGIFGLVAIVPLLYLLWRRLALERVRFISTLSDYLVLILLLLIVATGDQMRFIGGLDLAQAHRFVFGVLSFHPEPAPANAVFSLHLFLVCALLVCLPFTKLVHWSGLGFSPTLNQKNNPREARYA
jgi:nitrate reductase gamma subunit